MTTIRNEVGSTLILVVGLLMLSVSIILIAVSAVDYFLRKQTLAGALDRTLMISVNSYDFRLYFETGEYQDIALDRNLILSEFPKLLEREFSGATVRNLEVTKDTISAVVGFQWTPRFAPGDIGSSEITLSATIRTQLLNSTA